MYRKFLTVLVLPIVICCSGDKKCEPQTIATGLVGNDRMYSNPQLGISVFVPEGWVFIRNTADSIVVDKTFDLANPGNSTVNLFTMTVGMTGNPEPFSGGEADFSYDYLLAFDLCLSDSQHAEQDLQKIKSVVSKQYGAQEGFMKLNKQNMSDYSLISFGENKIQCFKITSMTASQELLHKGLAIKNYGCYNLMIQFTYSTEEQLQKINDVMSKIKFTVQ